jgi:hypothetical protein
VSKTGFAIPYLSIIIHAIARESHVGPSIYCQLEGSLTAFESSASNGSTLAADKDASDEPDEMEEEAVLELSFVPADTSSCRCLLVPLAFMALKNGD